MNGIVVIFLNLTLTAVFEGAAIWLFYREGRLVYYSLLCNLLTNPALNALLAIAVSLRGLPYAPALLALELAAVLAEAVVYRALTGFCFSRSLALSAALNCFSYACGVAFYGLFPALN